MQSREDAVNHVWGAIGKIDWFAGIINDQWPLIGKTLFSSVPPTNSLRRHPCIPSVLEATCTSILMRSLEGYRGQLKKPFKGPQMSLVNRSCGSDIRIKEVGSPQGALWSAEKVLWGFSTSMRTLLLELQIYKDIIKCNVLGAEVPGVHQEQLMQTLSMWLLKTHLF